MDSRQMDVDTPTEQEARSDPPLLPEVDVPAAVSPPPAQAPSEKNDARPDVAASPPEEGELIEDTPMQDLEPVVSLQPPLVLTDPVTALVTDVPSSDPMDKPEMSVDDLEAKETTPNTPKEPHTPPQSESPSSKQPERTLNVTDALSYLDNVKVQFGARPEVYNQFLDIMKEFKSQMIDTPGVIRRVSNLFRGHPALIQGFNTFLPNGYRIECSTDDQTTQIVVTTPSGTTMRTTNNASDEWATIEAPPPPEEIQQASEQTSTQHPTPAQQMTAGLDGQAIEPAVQYVQKIKQRCDAETYRQFLDILSDFNRGAGSIGEEEVSKQIARLFKDAPDLRADFRIFMPDRSELLDDSYPTEEPRGQDEIPVGDQRHKRKHDVASSSSGVGSQLKRKRKVVAEKEREREKEVISARASASISKTQLKKARSTPLQDHPSASATKYAPTKGQVVLPVHHIPTKAPVVPDETLFFERVKRSLDTPDTYNEFLKLINLFTQGYIDTARLVRESHNYLSGDGSLMRQFKEILGFDHQKEEESYLFEAKQHTAWTRPTVTSIAEQTSRADVTERHGSYRRLPSREVYVTCTGRDEMCRSVLNDEWVSHPASNEDSGIVTQRNVYEEALHRSEEERHEYDFHIEAITRTIAVLEPISNKIAMLPPEERGNFKLKPNLGGGAKPIHQRVIKKIYGREAGTEVLNAMQEAPSQAIPVVLSRLKQKEEEWKRAQREWNKVWKEVDARNYAKSLDHQSIVFKNADKKTVTTKALVSQIEAAREEQLSKRASLIDPLFARTRPRYQLEFAVDEGPVLQDCLKLVFSFLDRTQTQINFQQRKRIELFLRSFVVMLFMLEPAPFNSAFTSLGESVDSDISDFDIASILDDSESGSATSKGKGRKGASGGDLRKKLLKSEQAKSASRQSAKALDTVTPTPSRPTSPGPASAEEDSKGDANASARRIPRNNVFFTGTNFYVLIRLIEILCSRLALFRGLAAKLATDKSAHTPNPVAVQLGFLHGAGEVSPERYYDLLLESCERLFDNQIEQSLFEDQVRHMFGVHHAYKVFTIDKVIGALIKQVQAVFADPKSQELLEILKRDSSLPTLTPQDQVNSRRSTEKVLGPDENLFRIDWISDANTMTVQLLGKDDSSFDDSEVLTGRWQSYIDSFVLDNDTNDIPSSKMKSPFLRRNLPLVVKEKPPQVLSLDGLEMKVCVRTYRLFFVADSEDFLWRIGPANAPRKRDKELLASRLASFGWQ